MLDSIALGLGFTAVHANVTVAATFLLVVAGGLVTSNEAGLAVVDWPNSFGYNMFLYPLAKMTGGIYYEHAHRLYGSLVGLTTIVLAGYGGADDSTASPDAAPTPVASTAVEPVDGRADRLHRLLDALHRLAHHRDAALRPRGSCGPGATSASYVARIHGRATCLPRLVPPRAPTSSPPTKYSSSA